ncbi:GNAT family N-acetyltransferase [Luteibacter sp. 22Crub2.1]|uniref:GNAT family N-acetyltransferase n=1 Tax=Luteibacter sp. 22Crub2.1 TaxID=1283288 RepID=UPI0009A7054A|nr:GNAT family N-acetyltransferase [Luteibacter sp. 22Crub2.1]SKB82452.1 Protein N-acetyltransferase, RimJ/RimL family [Luteibacter sp. 22Crub2.1]
MHGPRIETDRLILRPTAAEDFEAWAACMGDPEVNRFLGGPQPRAVAWRNFMTMAGCWSINGFGMFSVIERASGRWIGRLGPWQPDGWPGHEIGWGMARDTWGKGYATEGAAASMDWAFDHLGWSQVIHSIAPTNIASIAVAKKLGSRWQGPGALPAPSKDAVVDLWGQTREQWLARRR